MDFGLFVPCHRFDAKVSVQELYRQMQDMVSLADEAGFKTAWFPEHHLVQYFVSPSPLMWMVNAAGRTKRIRLGAAILVIPYYNPLRLAGEIGMADHLCDGRLEIGVGRGAFEYEFDRFGITEQIGAERLREGMEIVEGLLTQDDFSYRGKTCSFGPATAVPRPLQQPHPPIWVAARSPDTIAWAMRRGYNLLTTPWRDPFSRIAKHHAAVMDIAKAEGITTPPRLAVSRMTYVGSSDGDALDAMADIQVSHRIFMRLFTNQAEVKGGFTEPVPVDDEYPKEQLLENLVAGSAATCVEKVRQYEKLGIDQFIVYGAFGPDHARTMASLRRFAEDVMPHFQKGSRA